jgi:hypothetical protein
MWYFHFPFNKSNLTKKIDVNAFILYEALILNQCFVYIFVDWILDYIYDWNYRTDFDLCVRSITFSSTLKLKGKQEMFFFRSWKLDSGTDLKEREIQFHQHWMSNFYVLCWKLSKLFCCTMFGTNEIKYLPLRNLQKTRFSKTAFKHLFELYVRNAMVGTSHLKMKIQKHYGSSYNCCSTKPYLIWPYLTYLASLEITLPGLSYPGP